MPLKKELMKILACPKCKGDVKQRGMFVVCTSCKLAYPIFSDVPDMLIEDAWELKRAKKSEFEHNLKI